MTSLPSKLYSDDVSLVLVLLDTNPFFWTASSFSFTQFLSHALAFLNSILLLNQLNQVVVIATGYNTCDCIYDSSWATYQSSENGRMPSLYTNLLQKLEEFLIKDEKLGKGKPPHTAIASSLFSGSLSMALCYIQRVFRSGSLHPEPRGSPDGPEQYVAVMNAIFSAQRSMILVMLVLIIQPFLQQAAYITGGVYVKPQHLEGLFQYLVTVFATDLHSRSFLCFCHKTTIDMGYICSVCLSIFCKHHKRCSTCGSVFGEAQSGPSSASDPIGPYLCRFFWRSCGTGRGRSSVKTFLVNKISMLKQANGCRHWTVESKHRKTLNPRKHLLPMKD